MVLLLIGLLVGLHVARTLLRRYGVVFWRMLEREAAWLPPWRDLLRVYRRLEARGDRFGLTAFALYLALSLIILGRGLARADALQGDTAKARAAYQDFLALWKDADPDIPILIAAKAEYAKLR